MWVPAGTVCQNLLRSPRSVAKEASNENDRPSPRAALCLLCPCTSRPCGCSAPAPGKIQKPARKPFRLAPRPVPALLEGQAPRERSGSKRSSPPCPTSRSLRRPQFCSAGRDIGPQGPLPAPAPSIQQASPGDLSHKNTHAASPSRPSGGGAGGGEAWRREPGLGFDLSKGKPEGALPGVGSGSSLQLVVALGG